MNTYFRNLKDCLKRYTLAILLLAALVVVMPADVSAATPKLNKTKATLNISDTLKLKVKNTKKTITYSSSKKSVATVSKKGVVTAKALGTATISAKISKSKTLKCKVTVAAPTYKISPSSKLYNGKKNTKGGYYLLRSYMGRLEKTKGGTIVLKAGTYTIKKAVYIPSNVTIKCEKGVKIVKDNGSDASVTMFGFVEPSKGIKGSQKNPVAVKAYNASSKVKFVGNDTTIDMKGDGIAFQFAHNQNITLSGINISNLDPDSHHFMDIISSKNIVISDCTMDGKITDKNSYNSFINIDLDGKNTFSGVWSSDDQTPCDTITISDCYFKNSGCAISTHFYDVTKAGKQIYHNKITIQDNVFDSVGTATTTSSAAIRMMSWKNSSIKDNSFISCTGGKGCPIRADGTNNITVSGNTFKECATNTLNSTYSGKKYVCSNNIVHWTKYYDYGHDDLTIYNTYTLNGTTKKIISSKDENYYEFYKNFVKNNYVSSKVVGFTAK